MKMKMLIVITIIVAALIPSVTAGPWGQVCEGNPTNEIRGCDDFGCGYYTAPRQQGSRMHLGVDVTCQDGSAVYAPFTGMIDRRHNPDGPKSIIKNGLRLRGSGFCVNMFFVKPVTYRGWFKKGEKIADMLPMQEVHPGIISYVHIQNCDFANITHYL
ncbi:leukocyte cell-derived chemotaxin-2-like [Pelodiscus sinensis]|uniref:leukocyte cell-derived chemotaxin-2-like n=1 Tax=Pelodiscus sinensis TaxID=13735 RepID=UPI000D71EC09|nr:leukocyte cell-derived chemotaxin-2-like [Pelodiscus sinensis]|eukprot:XP_025036981.1 leukocyte cell-derived chemotaxin-2-like [Pelodiscus sinensis]